MERSTPDRRNDTSYTRASAAVRVSVPRLSSPLPERFPRALGMRAGPDSLPSETFARSPRDIFWVAYWYRSHARCAAGECRCTEVRFAGRRYWLAGEGIAIVVYVDGTAGVYTLAHGPGSPALPWNDLSTHPVLTRADVEQLRKRGVAFEPREGWPDLPNEHVDVWAAWDAGCKHFGVDGAPATHAG